MLKGFSREVELSLRRYLWPGNIRQLQNVIRNVVVLHNDLTVELKHLPPPLDEVLNEEDIIQITPSIKVESKTNLYQQTVNDNRNKVRPLAKVEREAIEAAIDICSGNIPRAAAMLEVSSSTIYRKKQNWDDLAGR